MDADFNSRGIMSNNNDVLSILPGLKIKSKLLTQDTHEYIRGLRICWETSEDDFRYKLNVSRIGNELID